MDSLSGKPSLRYQLGRHLSETPYTVNASSEHPHSSIKRAESSDSEYKRASGDPYATVTNESSRKLAASGSGNGPRFVDASPAVHDGDESLISDSVNDKEYEREHWQNQQEKLSRRVLTQRYRLDQMKNVRKRISTENWIYDELEKLCSAASPESQQSYDDLVIDLDELLTCYGDDDRRTYLEVKLRDCPASRNDVEAFIDQCIEKIRPL